ncbi:hypothetical protein Trydic_g4826 [Trypoxylus dichotomus]
MSILLTKHQANAMPGHIEAVTYAIVKSKSGANTVLRTVQNDNIIANGYSLKSLTVIWIRIYTILQLEHGSILYVNTQSIHYWSKKNPKERCLYMMRKQAFGVQFQSYGLQAPFSLITP